MKRIGILYEHPEWFGPLFAELDRRGVAYDRIHTANHTFNPSERMSPYTLVVNRMSPSAWLRGHGQAIFHTLHYLAYLDDIGANVLNGYRAFCVEVSKARQIGLFAHLSVRYPAARVISHPSQAPAAAEGLRFPIMVKPNVGGSGAGIRAFASPEELARAAAEGSLDLGPDPTGLVQEYLPAEGGSIVRIEILGGEFLYAIRLRLVPGTFNLCPADYCELPGVADGVSGRGLPVEACEPAGQVLEEAKRIVAAAGLDLGGVGPGVFANAHMTPRDLKRFCQVTDAADALLKTAIARLKLSARAYHRVLKIARTIADLAGSAAIEPAHVSEAVQYRSLDRAMG